MKSLLAVISIGSATIAHLSNLIHPAFAQETSGDGSVLLMKQGTVEVSRASTTNWISAELNQVLHPQDRLRTGTRSRAEVRLSNLSVLPINESTTITFERHSSDGGGPILNLERGSIYFQSRERPRAVQFRTRLASGSIRGTEFYLAAADDGSTVVSLLDGEVDLGNEHGKITMIPGEEARVEPGRAPTKTAAINARNIIQWTLYYPGVLDPGELSLGAETLKRLGPSLDAYRNGDLLGALDQFPKDHEPESDDERVYLGALLLSVGQVDACERQLARISKTPEERVAGLAGALKTVIAAVNFRLESAGRSQFDLGEQAPSPSATEWLANSYFAQAGSNLPEALSMARESVVRSPEFGFGWGRVAELEFSFGNTEASATALERALQLTPRNAQALALKGFLLAAQNKISEAIEWFDRAIEADGALGNAWLGRGLCKIRNGDLDEGRMDLHTAAALEPNRAFLRSYLGKAFDQAGDKTNAAKEMARAKQLDPNDPTSWLYSALLNQRNNSINTAIRDLEQSLALNDNRRVYRSQMLLDQDRAVRGANLAGIYRDAQMIDAGYREAARAVNSDYANYSAHLFLANSFNALRDPRQISLRYETAWLSEFLLANLLAPVGAGSLSQNVSEQEYSKLFEQDHFGLSSGTEYLSGGDWTQSASQFGRFGNSSYAIDGFYGNLNGQRANEDVEQLTLSAKIKQQLTPKDSIYLHSIYYDYKSGDVSQYYDPATAQPSLRVSEKQEPILLGGYHHEWSPGNHTLFLASRMDDTFRVTDPDSQVLFLNKTQAGRVTGVSAFPTQLDYKSDFEAYSAELQQIHQQENHSVILGSRYQTGDFDTQSQFETSPINSDLERISLYAYENWRILDPLLLTLGVSYDRLVYPENHRTAPISTGEKTTDQVSPKAGLTWTPTTATSFRGSYTKSLGGVSFDQSFRLEPTQVAGFNQAYRSLIPESVTGSLAAPQFETVGLGFDHKFKKRTYMGADFQLLRSTANRSLGVIDSVGFPPEFDSSVTPAVIDYEEKEMLLTVNQLFGDNWSFGARYRLSDVTLDTTFTDIPTSVTAGAATNDQGLLHQMNLFALFNHQCGGFGLLESVWHMQSNKGTATDLPGDDFWQFNAFAGYRFLRRSAEIKIGVLNISDQDYRLNPINLYSELRRTRTFTASMKFYY